MAAARTARAVAHGHEAPRAEIAAAVRTSLAWLAVAHRGGLVEVRVPPFAAIQVGVPGQSSAHTRGTPPNVVEADASTWLSIVAGNVAWSDAVADRRVSASGAHADISPQLADLIEALASPEF